MKHNFGDPLKSNSALAIDFLNSGECFLLTTHVNSDIDGIGALMALRHILSKKKINCYIGLPDPPLSQCDFLHGWQDVHHIIDVPYDSCSHAIVVDSPNIERIGKANDYIAGLPILKLDHHKNGSDFGKINIVTSQISSTCELIFNLFKEAGWLLDKESASAIYAGILFDTGGFRFSNTTSKTFEVASELAKYDVEIDRLADQIFGNKSIGTVKLIGRAIDSLEIYHEGRVATLTIKKDEISSADPDGLVNYGLLIQEVEVAILLKEVNANKYRVSLRSKNEIDVSKVARSFSGGGHLKAAGCDMKGSAMEIIHKLLAEITGQLR